MAPAVLWAGPDEGCTGWEACLGEADTDIVAEWIERAVAFAKAVEIECKPKENPDE